MEPRKVKAQTQKKLGPQDLGPDKMLLYKWEPENGVEASKNSRFFSHSHFRSFFSHADRMVAGEDPQTKKWKMGAGEVEKKARNFGPPTLRVPPFHSAPPMDTRDPRRPPRD